MNLPPVVLSTKANQLLHLLPAKSSIPHYSYTNSLNIGFVEREKRNKTKERGELREYNTFLYSQFSSQPRTRTPLRSLSNPLKNPFVWFREREKEGKGKEIRNDRERVVQDV